ncbi:MAG: sodium-dependent bicarbonate transport family permease [Pirellulales bacterium]
MSDLLQEFAHNFIHNLFKPLLLFFYAGFLIPLLRVKLEFPKQAYQALTIFLLLGIGWHGGEELASLDPKMYGQAAALMVIGFFTNLVIGFAAYFALRTLVRVRRVDAATIAGYYGSDSAGTFVTAVGFLGAANIASASFMPVMLAVMEIPGCIVALYLISRLRHQGMDAEGNVPGEAAFAEARRREARNRMLTEQAGLEPEEPELVSVGIDEHEIFMDQSRARSDDMAHIQRAVRRSRFDTTGDANHESSEVATPENHSGHTKQKHNLKQLIHEVLLNQGIFLLFAGIAIGFISRLQGEKVVGSNDRLFIDLFPPLLCIFLLEMGITASRKLRDLKTAGWRLIAFGLIAPNVFAMFGMCVMFVYSLASGQPIEQGTYVLFAVLCGAASYIALPAVQQMAIPEASPTLPLASSLGVTFSYNVTIGISLYVLVAKYFVTLGPQLS